MSSTTYTIMDLDLNTLSRHLTLKNVFYALCGLAVVKFRNYLYWPIHSWKSPLRYLDGPENDSFFFGHFIKLLNEQGSTMYEKWVERHGKTFRYRGFVGSYQLYTMDMRAVNYIMSQPSIFDRSQAARRGMAKILGEGLLSADLGAHKRQRRIMNPSFGALQIRHLVPIFWEKSNQLRDIWLETINSSPEGVEIDVLSWLGRATLDVIGTAGFGYEFNSLQNGDENELAKAFKSVFDSDTEVTTMMMPTTGSRKLEASLDTMRRIGTKIVADKKTMLKHDTKEQVELQGRDLLTLLIKSNMAEQTKGTHDSQSMSDEEVLGQISTFLVAGHETSSTTTTWALYALTKHPEVQVQLRRELQSSGLGDEPSMADLDKLPYLDNVVRETLRVYPAVPNVGREAAVDAAIPVGESFKDRYGVNQTEIKVQKGDSVMIPVLAMNRAKDVWGEDGMEFRIKALLYSLVRSIEFDIDPELEIESKTGAIVTRPCVKSDSKKGNKMPLRCKAAAPM
ncbi:hypothetical protein FRC10_000360 [Ceratobasidium sp. 414]|nr:hypothetical protein FRC10_000360 [Ceratobasidium sp. 414]